MEKDEKHESPLGNAVNPTRLRGQVTSPSRCSGATGKAKGPPVVNKEMVKDELPSTFLSNKTSRQNGVVSNPHQEREGDEPFAVPCATGWISPELLQVPTDRQLESKHLLVVNSGAFFSPKSQTYYVRCFRNMNCHTTYKDDPASLLLLTWELDIIHITIWKSSSAKKNELVLETKLVKGDAISFHRYTHFIEEIFQKKFDSAYYSQMYSGDFNMHHLKQAIIEIRKQHPQESKNDPLQVRDSCNSALTTVLILTRDGHKEALILALKSLGILVDPKKTDPATALYVSLTLLLGMAPNTTTRDGATGEFRAIVDSLISVITTSSSENDGNYSVQDASGTIWDEAIGEEIGFSGGIQDMLYFKINLALVALICAVDVVMNLSELYPDLLAGTEQTSSPTAAILQFLRHAQIKSLLFSLVNMLGRPEDNPHCSCKCATLLCLLFTHAPQNEALKDIVNLSTVKAATAACNYGVTRHSKLERESNRLLQILHVKDSESL